jgi:hypothetical protein
MSDQELLKKLENSSPEDAKQLVIDSINPECRTVARSFFDCLEEQLKGYENKTLTVKQLENEFNSTITPLCMQKFNLEDCIQKFSPKH